MDQKMKNGSSWSNRKIKKSENRTQNPEPNFFFKQNPVIFKWEARKSLDESKVAEGKYKQAATN